MGQIEGTSRRGKVKDLSLYVHILVDKNKKKIKVEVATDEKSIRLRTHRRMKFDGNNYLKSALLMHGPSSDSRGTERGSFECS
jgi:hypothetical protein